MRRGTDRAGGSTVSVKTDMDKHVLRTNFERRKWHRCSGDDDDDWNVYWASVHSVRQLFDPGSGRRLSEHQIVNHFPNHYELTRKDLVVKNIKRYRKEREKLDLLEAQQGERPEEAAGRLELPPDFVPTTFYLPSDYALFVDEFRRHPNTTWIAKPTGSAQGRGIFLVSKLQQLKKFSSGQRAPLSQPLPFRESYVISRYIDNPLLIGGKKFDMRLYVLVTSYRPLMVYLYKGGFCRFCVEQYNTDVAEFDNVFIHLTNVAIQKNAEDYNDKHGGKWDINDLMLYIESTRGSQACDALSSDMEDIIVHTLKAVQNVMIADKHCFELYGFDILVDQNLRPWLIEVNASPSLSATTSEDRMLKTRLIHDTLNIVIPPGFCDSSSGTRMSAGWCEEEVVGDFVCIYNEGRHRREEEQRKERVRERRPLHRSGGWR